MLNAIIGWSLGNRGAIIGMWLFISVAGVLALRDLPIDAFPDTTPMQVQINTAVPSLAASQIEQQITYPVEQAISGLPRLVEVRSTSKLGLSQVIATFADGTDILTARNLINERLSTIEWPMGMPRPRMGPIATGLGEVLHYAIAKSDLSAAPIAVGGAAGTQIITTGPDLMELRRVHETVIKPALRVVPGTAEINTWGGLDRQYHVIVSPEKLVEFEITLTQVEAALKTHNDNVGGGVLRSGGEGIPVIGVGHFHHIEDIGEILIERRGNVPIRLKQLADIRIGPDQRRGAVTADGQGEVVLGLGFMLMGENGRDVTTRLRAKLQDTAKSLPPGVKIIPLYDRTELVDHVIDTVRKNLFEGGLLVIAVLFVFLGNLRAGLIVAAAIPLSMLCAFLGMWRFAIAGSLLSLGAIDFGLVVDSSVVMIENVVRRIAHDGAKTDRRELVRDAAIEVRKPTLFGELIILVVYIPILTLDGVAGKMFRPMALTVIFALLGSLVASLTLMPVLASLLLPKRMQETEPMPVRVAWFFVRPMRWLSWRYRYAIAGLGIIGLGIAVVCARSIGGEFVPKLSEGAIALNVKRLAGVAIEEVVRRNTLTERELLAKFPDEIEHIWSRCGTAEIATDPMGVEETDVFITLKPRSNWKQATTQQELMSAIKKTLESIPGQVVAVSQPIEQRVNEMTSGVKGDIAVKLFGDDFAEMERLSEQIQVVIRSMEGDKDVSPEQLSGMPVLDAELNHAALGRRGIPARAVLDHIECLAGKYMGDFHEGQFTRPIVLRWPEPWREKRRLSQLPIIAPTGERIRLGEVTQLRQYDGPSAITREWGQRRTVIQVNLKGGDVTGFVAEAKRRIAAEVRFPTNGRYRLEWGGTYEYFNAAVNRLFIVVPMALLLILALLYVSLGSWFDAFRVFLGVPFALVGGIAALVLAEMSFSVSAAIGFIALSGVSVLNGLLLVTNVAYRRQQGADLESAVRDAVHTRLRPVLMTALVAMLGFVPMAFSSGMGAEVQRPLAIVVIGGIVSSTLMTLLGLPAAYAIFGDGKRQGS